jgi:biopolymer transport protein ExbB
LLKIVQEAGWPIWPLILCSIAAMALIVERFMALRTARIAPGYLLGEVIAVTRNGLPSQDVISKLGENSLLGSVLASGLKLLSVDPRVGEVQLRQTFECATPRTSWIATSTRSGRSPRPRRCWACSAPWWA